MAPGKGWEQGIRALLDIGTFNRQLVIGDLWEADKGLTEEWTRAMPLNGGPRRPVRCGLPFHGLVETESRSQGLQGR